MSDIIPRKKAIPVQARRADPPPETVWIPGAAPVPPAQQAGGVTQNIFYVNVPAAQPVPPSPPPGPPTPNEVHIHTTNVYAAPVRRRLGRGTSFLGTLGLVLGCVAIGAAYLPQVMSFAKPIAVGGVICAGLALLGAMLFGRVGRGVPMLGLIACGVAYCLVLKNSGQLPSTISLPRIDLTGGSAPPAPIAVNPPPAPAANQPLNQPSQDSARLRDHSIFGDGSRSVGSKPSDEPAVAGRSTPLPAIPAVTPIVVPRVDLATAMADLDRARTSAASRIGVDYAAAKTSAADAQAEYQEAKIANAPGSAELVTASQKHLQADSQLNLIEARLRSDPAVVTAEAAVRNVNAPAR